LLGTAQIETSRIAATKVTDAGGNIYVFFGPGKLEMKLNVKQHVNYLFFCSIQDDKSPFFCRTAKIKQ
jgi:hypothetical protein